MNYTISRGNCFSIVKSFILIILIVKRNTKRKKKRNMRMRLQRRKQILMSKSIRIEQKGMTFDYDFGYSLPLFSFLLKKEGRRKGE